MTVKHELRLQGICPVDGSPDRYRAFVECNRTIPVEVILAAAEEAVSEPRYQEEITGLIAAALPGTKVTTIGTHSNVRTTVEVSS